MSRPQHPRPSILLLGFTVSEQDIATLIARSAVLPAQTHNFAKGLSELLSGVGDVSYLSFLPVPDYPEYPQIVFRSGRFEGPDGPGLKLGFVNLLGAKHLSRSLMLRWRARRFLREVRPEIVVVHGVHTPLLSFARRLRKRGARTVAVLTDPPGVIRPSDSGIRRLLKGYDISRVTSALSSFDSVVALSEPLATDFAPGVPALVTPGFAPDIPDVVASEPSSPTFDIAYAGGLNRNYGVEALVAAVRSLEDPSLRLHLFGRGNLEEWIRSQAEIDDRIAYHGALPVEELRERLAGMDALVNPRRLDGPAVRHSFPSKLLEYAALGVPTVTTPLPTLGEDFSQRLSVTKDDAAESIAQALAELRALPTDRRAEIGREARRWVREELTPKAQGRRLAVFLGLTD